MTLSARLVWVHMYEQTGDVGLTCRRFGMSRPTLRKWWRRYQAEGIGHSRSERSQPASPSRRGVCHRGGLRRFVAQEPSTWHQADTRNDDAPPPIFRSFRRNSPSFGLLDRYLQRHLRLEVPAEPSSCAHCVSLPLSVEYTLATCPIFRDHLTSKGSTSVGSATMWRPYMYLGSRIATWSKNRRSDFTQLPSPILQYGAG